MALLLTDKDLPQCLSMAEAVASIEAALDERRKRTSVSHPRTYWPVGSTGFTITPGGFETTGVLGMRVYLRGGGANDQLTAVWDAASHRLEGIIVGSDLGAIRTGAIGGVAFRRLAPASASSAAAIGGGLQTRTQLQALLSVRPSVESVALFRRDPLRREASAENLTKELGIRVTPAPSSEVAVAGADVVILATDSPTPVVQAGWLREGAHVNSLGPKYVGNSEIGLDLVNWSDEIVCDFPEEYQREKEFLLHGSPRESSIRDLAELAGDPLNRPRERKTLFLSHGLAGTEVMVAHRALENAQRLGLGTRIETPDRVEI
jgi:ornithine cyclodeaminase/alanine dehydrogenase-like protein (mu-crystallin family)